MSAFPPWHPRWGEGMPSPSPRSRPLVVEPASQLLRRKTHRVEVIARSIRVLGVRPRKIHPPPPRAGRSLRRGRPTAWTTSSAMSCSPCQNWKITAPLECRNSLATPWRTQNSEVQTLGTISRTLSISASLRVCCRVKIQRPESLMSVPVVQHQADSALAIVPRSSWRHFPAR